MQDPVYNRIVQTPRPSLLAANGLLLLAAAGLWLFSLSSPALVGGSVELWAALYYLPFMLLPAGAYVLRRRNVLEGLRLNPLSGFDLWNVLALAASSAFVADLAVTLWSFALSALGLPSGAVGPAPRTERELIMAILAQAAMPAACEELLFRGVLLSAWESRGTRFAIAVTAALFALLHGDLYGLPAYLLVGGVSAFLTFALDSVYAGVIYHTVYNALCLIFAHMVSNMEVQTLNVDASVELSTILLYMSLAIGMSIQLRGLMARSRRLGREPIPRVRRPLSRREKATLAAAVGAMAAMLALNIAQSAMG